MVLQKLIDEIADIIQGFGVSKEEAVSSITEPPSEELGDLATNISFKLSKKLGKVPAEIAEELAEKIRKVSYVSRVEVVNGYVNIFFDWDRIFESLTQQIMEAKFPVVRIEKKRIMVEHTSVNPNKALHIGHARNACLGDVLQRVLRFCGHEVVVANYIDDTGNQVADVVVGFKFLGFPEESDKKFDHYCGDEVYVKVNKMYKENPELLEKRKFVMKKIEEGDNEIAIYAKKLAEKVLREQLKTLWNLGIYYDLLNWESDILHSKLWDKAFEMLKSKGYVYFAESGPKKGCWLLKLSDLPEFKGLKDPDKVLVRSDGTVVYAGKDIAYAMWKHGLVEDVFRYFKFAKQPNGSALWSTTLSNGEASHPKFNDVDVSINVIDVRQSYEQNVVASALKMIGHGKKNYVHYAYEVVSLSKNTARKLGIETDEDKQFVHMSGRKGWFINVDTLYEELVKKAAEETKKRHEEWNDEKIKKVAEALARSVIRFEMVKVSPEKIIVFDMDEAMKLEGSTAPYVMYAYTRCRSILRKAGEPSFESLVKATFAFSLNDDERRLVKKILEFENVIKKVEKELKLTTLTTYAVELAASFNEFYHKVPVLGASEEEKSKRLVLVKAFEYVMGLVMDLLGLEKLEEM